MEIALSLGTNLGDRLANLHEAAKRIATLPGTRIIARSRLYETAPVGVKPQYQDMAYLNAVLIIETELPVETISDWIHAIEAAMGRVRGDDRFAPRPIDIDILYAGREIRDSESLTLPHPRWAQRRFVLQPLADVRPGMILPGYAKPVSELLANLGGESDVVPYHTDW
jgi:2-amino-4-hydroxy-6-hydroxymethyldihydropteridine diphosphokinase